MKLAPRTRTNVRRLALAIQLRKALRPDLTHQELAAEFGISRSMVTYYLYDRTWKIADQNEGTAQQLMRLLTPVMSMEGESQGRAIDRVIAFLTEMRKKERGAV